MSNNDVKEKEFNISSDSIHSLMKMKLDSLEHRMDSIHTVYNELEYYIRVHDVHDEGFMTISNFASKITQRMDTLKEEIKKHWLRSEKLLRKCFRTRAMMIKYAIMPFSAEFFFRKKSTSKKALNPISKT
jgi:hypothetical protein